MGFRSGTATSFRPGRLCPPDRVLRHERVQE
jgi:hypothetical protein